MRTVEKRWLISTAILSTVSSRNCWKTFSSFSASSAAVGSSSTITSQSRMNARASAIFCHSPPDSSRPLLNQRPSMVS